MNVLFTMWRTVRPVRGGTLFCAAAIAMRWWIAPNFEKLPADYANETRYDSNSRFRLLETTPWSERQKIATRVDQTFTVTGNVAKINGHIDWTSQSGDQTYETVGLYGVDRQTRANLAGYGNQNRTGQFLFPPHTRKTNYTLWDPFYAGPRQASFNHTEVRNGLLTYVFNCRVDPFDETDGYLAIPGVPQRYRVFSVGRGKVWVEPVSGWVVDFEDRGLSYFLDAQSGQRRWDFCTWESHYDRETKIAQLQYAIVTRRRMFVLEDWLPLGLTGAGLVWFALAPLRRRRVGPLAPASAQISAQPDLAR